MTISEVLDRCGGLATRQQLVRLTSRAEFEAGVRSGQVLVLAPGRCASPALDAARRAAHRLSGVVSDESAALIHGWAVRQTPRLPHVTVPRNRKLTLIQCEGVVIHRANLGPDDVGDGVTTQERTLLDCGRRLEPDAGLAVFDSALRDGFSHVRMVAIARDARGPDATKIRWIAAHASPDAANPFESGLRSIALEVSGLSVRPQVPIFGTEFLGRPDLADEELRVVCEADSFEWHGGRAELQRDARRYNRFVVNGWLVLRFSWEDVMCDPRYVRNILEAVVSERTYQRIGADRPA